MAANYNPSNHNNYPRSAPETTQSQLNPERVYFVNAIRITVIKSLNIL